MSSIEPELAGPGGGRLRAEDAGPFVRVLNAHTGSQFTFLGMAELGETNAAAFVRWPDGRDGVLTRTRYPIQHLERTAEILDLARARGLPVPRYELIVQVQDWTVVVQERLSGAPLAGSHIDLPMMEAILALIESFAGLLVQRPDVPTIDMKDATDVAAAGDPRYAAVEGYDDRARELLARIRAVREASDRPMTGHDLVHARGPHP